METSSLEKAEQLSAQALKARDGKKFESALSMFQQAVELCIHFINVESETDEKRDQARLFCSKLLDQAEALRSYMQKGGILPESFTAAVVPSSGALNLSADEPDGDVQRLFKQIEMSTVIEKVSKLKFEDVVGLSKAKGALNESVVLPMLLPTLMGDLKTWQAILLFGPPGTGKTHLARAAASECNCTIMCISSAAIGSKWHGDSERMMRMLFEKARRERPTIIFIDEIEWLCGARSNEGSESSSRLKTELLQQMDGAQFDNSQVLVLAATNKPHALDEAFRRRFDCRIYVPLPEKAERLELFQKMLADIRHCLSDDDLRDLSDRTEGYSGHDISVVVKNARMEPIRKIQHSTHFKEIAEGFYTPCVSSDDGAREMKFNEVHESKLVAPPITKNDVHKSLSGISASVSQASIGAYEKFNREYGKKN